MWKKQIVARDGVKTFIQMAHSSRIHHGIIPPQYPHRPTINFTTSHTAALK